MRDVCRAGQPDAGREVPTLTEALLRVYEERPVWRADPAARHAERRALAEAHEAIYAGVLTRSAACTS